MNKHLNRAANLLLLILAIFPQLYLIIESLGCTVSSSFPLWVLALCIGTWYAASFRRGILIGMPSSALLLFLAYRRYGANPAVELTDLFDKVTGVYYEHIYAPGQSYDFLNAVSSHTLVLLLFAFLLSAYMAAALTSRNGRVIMSLMGTCPFFACCLFVNGMPSAAPVVGMMLFWSLLLVSGGSYLPDSNDGKAVFITALPLCLLLCAVLWLNKPEDYRYDEQDAAFSEYFDDLSRLLGRRIRGSDLFNLPHDSIPDSQGLALTESEPESMQDRAEEDSDTADHDQSSPWMTQEGDMELDQPFDPELLQKQLISVQAEYSGNLYLRTVSYGEYTGTGWRKADNNAPSSSLPFTAHAVENLGEASRLSVKSYADLAYICIPYYSDTAQLSDSSVPSRNQHSYDIDYIRYNGDFSGIRLPKDYLEAELAYALYAHSYYTRLPEETRSALLSLAEQEGVRADSPDVIQWVADYVQSAGEYDLETQFYPSSDYALYFLTEAHRGYCIHFATAAAAMYRSLGIPARVTEGFLIRTDAGQFTNVTGADAHAWVEVYQDGVGWIPVEVTGHSGLEPENDAVTEGTDTPEDPQQEEQTQTEDTQEAESEPQPAETQTAEPDPVQVTEPSLDVGIIAQPDLQEPSPTSRPFPWKAVRWVLLVLLLLSLLPLWYLLQKRRNQNQITQPNGRKAAVAIWKLAAKISAYGAKMPEPIRNTAEKASFSAHSISQAELETCRALLEQMAQETYAELRWTKKIRFRYLQGLR